MDKEKMKAQAKKRIDELFIKIEELENKKDKVEGDLKVKVDELLLDLKHKRDNLNAEVDKLHQSTVEEWEKHKDTFEDSMNSFKDGIDKLVSYFAGNPDSK